MKRAALSLFAVASAWIAACGNAPPPRAVVLSIHNVDLIPDGSVLFSCNVNVAATASGIYPLSIGHVVLATPQGQAVADEVSVGGAIVVGNTD